MLVRNHWDAKAIWSLAHGDGPMLAFSFNILWACRKLAGAPGRVHSSVWAVFMNDLPNPKWFNRHIITKQFCVCSQAWMLHPKTQPSKALAWVRESWNNPPGDYHTLFIKTDTFGLFNSDVMAHAPLNDAVILICPEFLCWKLNPQSQYWKKNCLGLTRLWALPHEWIDTDVVGASLLWL